jgi:hypothetical protein
VKAIAAETTELAIHHVSLPGSSRSSCTPHISAVGAAVAATMMVTPTTQREDARAGQPNRTLASAAAIGTACGATAVKAAASTTPMGHAAGQVKLSTSMQSKRRISKAVSEIHAVVGAPDVSKDVQLRLLRKCLAQAAADHGVMGHPVHAKYVAKEWNTQVQELNRASPGGANLPLTNEIGIQQSLAKAHMQMAAVHALTSMEKVSGAAPQLLPTSPISTGHHKKAKWRQQHLDQKIRNDQFAAEHPLTLDIINGTGTSMRLLAAYCRKHKVSYQSAEKAKLQEILQGVVNSGSQHHT